MNVSGGDEPTGRSRATGVGVSVAIALVALWWQAGERGFDHGRADHGSDQVVQTARGIKFHLPNGWREITPSAPPLRKLGLTLLWAYAPVGEPALGEVAVGLGDGSGPALLSRGSLAALGSPRPASIEELRSNAFVRVEGTLAGQRGSEAVVVYGQPATPANVEVVCLAEVRRTGSPESNACRLVAGTLELSSSFGRLITLTQLSGNPARVHKALGECYGRAAHLREALWEAAGRDEQARQAGKLATLYELAARRLSRIHGDPIAAPAQDALRRTLQRAASGYALLKQGALQGDRHDWAAGRRRVLVSEPQMDRAAHEVLAP